MLKLLVFKKSFFFSCPVAISHIALKIFKSRFVDTMKDFYIVFKIYLIVQKKIFLVELKFWNGCICASLSPPPSKPKTYWSRFPQPHVMNIISTTFPLAFQDNLTKYVRHFAQPCGPKRMLTLFYFPSAYQWFLKKLSRFVTLSLGSQQQNTCRNIRFPWP